MVDGVCKEKFPKLFAEETTMRDDEAIYPTYRRRVSARAAIERAQGSRACMPHVKKETKKGHVCACVCESVAQWPTRGEICPDGTRCGCRVRV